MTQPVVNVVRNAGVEPHTASAVINLTGPGLEHDLTPMTPFSSIEMRLGMMTNKSLSSLPKPMMWNPRSGCDTVARKWLKSLLDYCDLLNWQVPLVMSHFMEGTAVDWWTQLIKQCDRDRITMSVSLLTTKFFAQYATSLISEKNQARLKLFNNKISMSIHPDYLQYELAFQACMLDCEDLSMPDQIMWFCKGLTPVLHMAVGMQPITNKEWPHISPLMEFTRGYVARSLVFTTPPFSAPTLNFHRADNSASPVVQPFDNTGGWTQKQKKNRNTDEEPQPVVKKQAVVKKGAGEKGGKAGGSDDIAAPRYLSSGAVNPDWADENMALERLTKICQVFSEGGGYMHTEKIPMAKITVICMRADGVCPRSHVWGHMDKSAKGGTVCTAPGIAHDWPQGTYTKNGKGGKHWPSMLGKLVGVAWDTSKGKK